MPRSLRTPKYPSHAYQSKATTTELESAAKSVEDKDREAGHALAQWRSHPAVELLAKLGKVGYQGPLYAMGAVLGAVGLLTNDRRTTSAGISMVAAVGIADGLKTALKNRVKRSRPDRSLNDGDYCFEVGGSPDKEEQSFPSGHVACTVAAAGAVSRAFPHPAPYMNTAVVAIAASRMLKARHWPLDVLAGLGIGIVASGLVGLLKPVRSH